MEYNSVLPAYSGTPPYDHLVYKTTSLLRPYSFKPKVKNIDSFYYFQDPVNATTSLLRPGFYGPTVVVLTGFHCNLIFHIKQKKNHRIQYLTGQNPGLSGQKNIWPVIMTGDLLSVILSPGIVLKYIKWYVWDPVKGG